MTLVINHLAVKLDNFVLKTITAVYNPIII